MAAGVGTGDVLAGAGRGTHVAGNFRAPASLTSCAEVARNAPVSFQHAQIIENRYTYSCNKTCRVDCLNMRPSAQIPKEENSALFGPIGDGLAAVHFFGKFWSVSRRHQLPASLFSTEDRGASGGSEEGEYRWRYRAWAVSILSFFINPWMPYIMHCLLCALVQRYLLRAIG